jgi:hypothetical protein
VSRDIRSRDLKLVNANILTDILGILLYLASSLSIILRNRVLFSLFDLMEAPCHITIDP